MSCDFNIFRHYSISEHVRRKCVLPAAVLIQTCLGGVYAWSAFVPALLAEHGLSAGQTQLIFGATIAVFTVAMVFAGRLLTVTGPRFVGLLGAVLFAAGHFMAGASAGRMNWLLAGFGLFGGTGIGCGYVAALTAGMQWFPRRKGLVTGVAVAGFGAGAIVLSALATWLLRGGWPVLSVFSLVGWGYGLLICLGAALLFRPPASGGAVGWRPVSTLLRERVFVVLVLGMFCGTFAGLLVIGNLKLIGVDGGLSPVAAAMAISFFAVGNALGRIVWGWIYDRTSGKIIPWSLWFLAVALLLLPVMRLAPRAFAFAALLAGFGFGACFVLYAAQAVTSYGPAAVARVYPFVFLGYGLAGISGPAVGGYLYDLTNSYVWSIMVAVLVLSAGARYTSRALTASDCARHTPDPPDAG